MSGPLTESPVRPLVSGSASGDILVLDAPLSFWGGLDPETGLIIDRRHPQCGDCVTDRILVMSGGRGSSSSSTVLAEAIRLGKSPSAIILEQDDSIIVLGSLVAAMLYDRVVPVVVLDGLRVSDVKGTGGITVDHDVIRFESATKGADDAD